MLIEKIIFKIVSLLTGVLRKRSKLASVSLTANAR